LSGRKRENFSPPEQKEIRFRLRRGRDELLNSVASQAARGTTTGGTVSAIAQDLLRATWLGLRP
jgi:hypothetical protein